jgi:hypothetical protein
VGRKPTSGRFGLPLECNFTMTPFSVRLPMPLPITSGHPEDNIVEQYAMNRLAAENLAAFEEHLLVCH